jgi:hypothetical protein
MIPIVVLAVSSGAAQSVMVDLDRLAKISYCLGKDKAAIEKLFRNDQMCNYSTPSPAL